MTLDAAGRAQRARGQELFDRLAERYAREEDLGRSKMFGSEALNHRGSIVGFVGLEGQLVVKLDPTGLRDVSTAGPTVPVRIGRGIAQAWIGLPFGGDPDTVRRWSEALAAGVSAARASVTG